MAGCFLIHSTLIRVGLVGSACEESRKFWVFEFETQCKMLRRSARPCTVRSKPDPDQAANIFQPQSLRRENQYLSQAEIEKRRAQNCEWLYTSRPAGTRCSICIITAVKWEWKKKEEK
ncbi:hypothetical protein B0H19DRAFT_1148277 [Mycena capillaripes]|nr:hypothetical protein B0H19DRAFT_1148277 [Mycena capillaripes]